MLSKRVCERGGQYGDTEHLDQIRQWCGILKGMSAIRVEESAAIRAQILGDLQRRHRPLSDHLFLPFNGRRCDIAVPVHRHTLRHERQGANHRNRQQYP